MAGIVIVDTLISLRVTMNYTKRVGNYDTVLG